MMRDLKRLEVFVGLEEGGCRESYSDAYYNSEHNNLMDLHRCGMCGRPRGTHKPLNGYVERILGYWGFSTWKGESWNRQAPEILGIQEPITRVQRIKPKGYQLI